MRVLRLAGEDVLMNKIVRVSAAFLTALLNFTTSDAQPIASTACPPCPINTLCANPCDTAWVTGSFITNGRNPIQINGTGFGVQRIDAGLYAITFKRPFCCPISVVSSSNIPSAAITSNRVLTNPRTFPTGGSDPIAMAISQFSHCLMTANRGSNDLSVFGINRDGSLSLRERVALAGEPVTAGIAASANSCFLATTPGTTPPTLSFFRILQNCALQFLQTINNTPRQIRQLAFASGASCPLALAFNEALSIFELLSINFDNCPPTGNPNFTPLAQDVNPVAIALSRNNCAAIVDQVANAISLFNIVGAPNCQVIQTGVTIPNSPTAEGPVAALFSPEGDYFCVLNQDSNNISGFRVISDGTGRCVDLIEVAGSPFNNEPGSVPVDMTFSPDGQNLFVANQGNDTITAFNIDPVTYQLAQAAGSPVGLPAGASGPTAIQMMNPAAVAVANGATNNVTTFQVRNANTMANSVQICEAITPGCFILQLPPEVDACATVTFFATPCT